MKTIYLLVSTYGEDNTDNGQVLQPDSKVSAHATLQMARDELANLYAIDSRVRDWHTKADLDNDRYSCYKNTNDKLIVARRIESHVVAENR